MATNDQNEFGLPTSKNSKRTSSSLLPKIYRTSSNQKFLQATVDQLTQPGTVKKVNGYIGRQNAKAVLKKDIFIDATDTNRQNYQLEPSAVIQDYLGNINFYKDYIDYINHIETSNGLVNNHERLNKQEFYSWNPHIDWDKFVNYRNYYWLPTGPTPIEVSGLQQSVLSSFDVKEADNGNNYSFQFSQLDNENNPTITLYRGYTYVFNLNCDNNPFSIKFKRSEGNIDRYNDGITGNGNVSGQLVFEVPLNCPNVLFYTSEKNLDAGGVFHILDIDSNTYLNVEQEILGKKTYRMTNGYSLSNGMKLKFTGQIFPEIYSMGFWYVEGVGTSIKLISEKDLEIVSSYTNDITLLFDDQPFDETSFSSATTFSQNKDYFVINRASPDKNPWSRYNRWFHQDIILIADEIAGSTSSLNQTARAIRPIIEFESGLKLYNFGHVAKKDVDLIDTYTLDVFSKIEGQLGYVIDQVPLVEGMRILFTADTDSLVNNKIFNVSFVSINKPEYTLDFLGSTNTNIDTDSITFSVPHKLSTGNKVIYRNNGNINVGGLLNGKTYYVSVIDSYNIQLYFDQTLINLVDIQVKSPGTHSFDVIGETKKQIRLTETDDAISHENETILVRQGSVNQGKMYWYNGTSWDKCQSKLSVNQEPLFDVYDSAGVSFGNVATYNGSTFVGSKIFSYKANSTGTTDTELGIKLSYQNIDNIGDILFNFNLLSDSFNYKTATSIITKNINAGYVRLVKTLSNFSYANGWAKSEILNVQPIVRNYKDTEYTNNFPIDVYDNVDDLQDLHVHVYINGTRLNPSFYSIETGTVRKFVKILDSYQVKTTDVVSIKCFAKQPKNENGYYEIPINLQNNPLNDDTTSFTLGEVTSHVDSIVENLSEFTGTFPGAGNLRDLGSVTAYGTKFVQHSSPLALSLLHLGSKDFNILKALQQARDDYGRFKRAFLVTATNSGIDTDVRRHVDYVLSVISQNKSKFEPYYFSDMFGLGAYNKIEYVVDSSLVRRYPITNIFSMSALSNKAVYVYVNGEQLLHNRDYIFGDDHYIEILIDLMEEAVIEIIEYESTDGCYCPSTPSKLGLYPVYEPKKFVDDTYLEPKEVIQGHDGSIILAFGDFRDDLLLELEKRIFNNIKISYNTEKFNIYDFIPSYGKTTDYSRLEFEKVLGTFFYQWTTLIAEDFTKLVDFDKANPFTPNFRNNYAPDGSEVPAFWRGVYKWFLNTDRPHTHPWECLNLSIEPSWWQEVYGPAPYTSDNQILWDDIRQGILRIPNIPPKKNKNLAKPILEIGVPVNASGELLDPLQSNFVDGVIKPTNEGYYIFGDQGPVETAWRRSSYYPFAIMQALLLLNPSKTLALAFDLSRVERNLADQLIYKETGLRIRLSDIVVPTLPQSAKRTYASGLVNYIIDYVTSDSTALVDQYKESLSTLTIKVGSKLGGFTAKDKVNLVLDSKNPSSTGGVFVPQENYSIFLNVSSPVKKLNYSGIIVTKYTDGFEIKGYNFDEPFFKYYSYELTDRLINVGGISETYVTWAEGKTYAVGTNIKYNNSYYKTTATFTASATFDSKNLVKLPALPMVGGVDVYIRKTFNKREELILSYGTKLGSIQEVADFIQGYSAYLESQGFVFDTFNDNLQTISNWETSLKEFLFWTTQNWGSGAVISLSPAANLLVINSNYSVVNDVLDPFYEYKIFRVDGQKLEHEFTSVLRDGNVFSLQPVNTNQGIYGASFYLVQKEHVLVLDNSTMFNDTIYDMQTGIKQDRIKLLGYMTTNWNGSFNIPGFLFDQAQINDWQPWVDYNLGEVVKYGAFYYSALQKTPGTENFEEMSWNRLQNKPEKMLKPNWDYRSQQFTDFYDLDTSNFDSNQQKYAQHLIGYQKRQYLQNIIQDDVSQYNFYQGYIREKGTLNSLSKLFDVLSSDNLDSLTFNEEWAVRVGQYGASAGFNEIEFILDQSKFKLSPQPFEIVDHIDNNLVDFVYRQTPSDFYIKPKNYSGQVWPTVKSNQYLRSPGFARYDDVKIYVDSLEKLVGITTVDVEEGDYVWSAFENATSPDFWNVYRVTNITQPIQNITYASGTLTIELSGKTLVTTGDIIGILNPNEITGYHKVYSVSQNKILIKTAIANWDPISNFSKTLIFRFVSCKVSSVDNLNSVIPQRIKTGELVWSKDDGAGLWAVYKNEKVFKELVLDTTAPGTNSVYARQVAITSDGTTAAVSSYGFITLLTKTYVSAVWGELQKIIPTVPLGSYGVSFKFSPDKNILVIGSGDETTSYAEIFTKNNLGLYELSKTISNPSTTPDYIQHVNVVNNGANNYIISLTTNTKTKFYTYNYLTGSTPTALPTVLSFNGSKVKMSDRANVVVVSVPSTNTVSVYKKQSNNTFTFSQTLVGNSISTDDRFGQSIDITKDATSIVVSSPLTDLDSIDKGKVSIFKLTNGTYSIAQEIFSPKKDANENYGVKVQFTSDGKSLVIISGNGSLEKIIEWREDDPTLNLVPVYTTFDNSSTRFKSTITGGRVDVFNVYNNNYIYGESLESSYIYDVDPITKLPTVTGLSSDDGYGSSIAVGDISILVGAPYHDSSSSNLNKNVGRAYFYYKKPASTSWSVLHQQQPIPDVKKIKKAFLYNRKEQELVQYLDIVDPTQGKIPGIADEEIRFKSYFDPAVYSIGPATLNVNDGIKWTKDKIGLLWWDLSRAKFLENSIGEVVYRSTTWNKLYDSASIDVYEWVETKYLPSEWDKLADTEKGLANNISGKSKYGDSVYSVVQTYDTVSKKFINLYYFWVKSKTVVPNVRGRNISSAEVASLIADPLGYGYPCLALTGPNSFSLVNVDHLLKDDQIVLSVQYWTIDNQEINIHSQWSLIDESSLHIPPNIEKKWIHSLVGRDDNDKVVPDLTLPIKQRYGIEFRPRQGMFVNRGEALKLFIEGVNDVMSNNLIVDNYDISSLEKLDNPPSKYSGLWDESILTNNTLRFISTGSLVQASFEPVIENGKIISVTILESGKGYINAPYITVQGSGEGANLRTILNDAGQVTGVDIISSGYGYDSSTILSVRPFSVLIESDDNSYNKWAIYTFNSSSKVWSKIKSQSFDVTNFWKKVDWYASGYNQFTKINYSINNTYELTNLQTLIGDIVKVQNIGTGGWVLLEKIANNVTVDYTLNYSVIGRENGTIEFSSSLYNFKNAIVGYDSNLFDSNIYDSFAYTELNIILDCIKNNILINELRPEYIKLFFSSLRYVLKEQPFVDWVTKTSFIKSQHNVGYLKQKVNYNNDNLPDYEAYINEVKPYSTNIREFVSSYQAIDNSNTMVSDFDIIPYVNLDYDITKLFVTVDELSTDTAVVQSSNNEILNTYPWKNWKDNLGFTITSIEIADGGSGYITPPVVKIVGGYGTGAVAKAYISNGAVNRITVINPGVGYLKAPTVVLDGGLAVTGVAGRAVAIIESQAIRSNKISVKFDRITKNYFVYEINESEIFYGTGSRLQFDLKYSPNKTVGKSKIRIVDGDLYKKDPTNPGTEVLRNEYKLLTKKSKTRGYTSYYGSLLLSTAPTSGQVIIVEYEKDVNYLSAADRINFHYNVESGKWGKDLAQLMTGLDYGGVNITGLGFKSVGGWDALPWFTDAWDSFDEDYDNLSIVVAADQHVIPLKYTPTDGQVLNVYVNRLIDVVDPLTLSRYVGNGSTKDFAIPNTPSAPVVFVNGVAKEFGVDYSLVPFSPISRIVRFITAPAQGLEVKIELYGKDIRLDDPNYGINTNLLTFHGNPLYSITGAPFDGIDVLGLDGESYVSALQNTDYAFGTRNFTIEFFVRPDGLPANIFTPILSIGQAGGGKEIRIGHNINGTGVGFVVPNNSNNGDVFHGNGHILTPNHWHHIALVREDDKVYFFANGEKLYTVNSVDFNFAGLGPLQIGYGLYAQDGYFTGSLSNIRILNGTALYNNTYEVPTAPFTAITNTVFLQLNTHAINPNVVMTSVIADGTINSITIPSYVQINEGDRIVIRKEATDGSSIVGYTELDTQLNGGAFEGSVFSSATGLDPADINIDGDGFVTETNSETPEELLSGRVFDTLAVKVYHRPTGGAPKILFKNYVGNGTDTVYKIGQYFPTERSVIVKVGGTFLENLEYTLDWENNTIVLDTPPPEGQVVSIVSFGFNASNILDNDYFIGDGVTEEFVTKAPWIDGLNSTVLVNGQVQNYTLFKTDATYNVANLVGIKFANPIPANALVNYLIDTDPVTDVTQQTSAVMKSQTINFVSGTPTYSLDNLTAEQLTALNLQPYENNVLVRVGQTILQPSKTINFILSNNVLEYTLSPYEANEALFDITQVRVFIAGIELKAGKEFTVDFYGITIKINKRKYISGAPMIVVISAQSDYKINSNGTITFSNDYQTGTAIEIISFYNHAILKVERSVNSLTPANTLVPGSADYYTFANKLGKRFKLDKPVSSDDYIWVVKNGQLLSHSVDYSLELDHKSVRLKDELFETDVVQIIAFSSDIRTYPVSYMQFKDILNRVQFKRLNKDKQTRLAQDLAYNDTYILLEDSSQFAQPSISANKPGVIEIKGERIEYFAIEGNALTHLRRGTLGTGIPLVHKEGSHVIDIGPSETIPYSDTELVENVISDGTKIVNLTFVPTKGNQDTVSANYEPSGVSDWFTKFGYTYLGEYSASTLYTPNNIVFYQNAYYVTVANSKNNLPTNTTYWALFETEIPVGYGVSNDIEVFVGGYSLTTPWEANTLYKVGTLITKDSSSYKCTVEHTSSSSFINDYSNWKLFVGNIKLNKNPYLFHDINQFIYSPEGDVKVESDFAVDGTSKQLRLTNELAVGTRITVVKKTGIHWDNNLYGSTKISSFLRAAPAVWYTNMTNS